MHNIRAVNVVTVVVYVLLMYECVNQANLRLYN